MKVSKQFDFFSGIVDGGGNTLSIQGGTKQDSSSFAWNGESNHATFRNVTVNLGSNINENITTTIDGGRVIFDGGTLNNYGTLTMDALALIQVPSPHTITIKNHVGATFVANLALGIGDTNLAAGVGVANPRNVGIFENNGLFILRNDTDFAIGADFANLGGTVSIQGRHSDDTSTLILLFNGYQFRLGSSDGTFDLRYGTVKSGYLAINSGLITGIGKIDGDLSIGTPQIASNPTIRPGISFPVVVGGFPLQLIFDGNIVVTKSLFIGSPLATTKLRVGDGFSSTIIVEDGNATVNGNLELNVTSPVSPELIEYVLIDVKNIADAVRGKFNNITKDDPFTFNDKKFKFTYNGNLATGNPATEGNDFTIYPVAKINARVWDDKNADGVQNGGEPGIPNVTVYLYKLPPRTEPGEGPYVGDDVALGGAPRC